VSMCRLRRTWALHGVAVCRDWVKKLPTIGTCVSGHGQMKPEQLENSRASKREVTKLKGRARTSKKSRGLLREGIEREVLGFIAKPPGGIWPAGWLCEALVSREAGLCWLTRPRSQRSTKR